MGQPIYGGLANILVQKSESGSMLYCGMEYGSAKFTVVGIDTVVILDSRESTLANLELAQQNGLYDRIYQNFNRPAMLEVESEDGIIYIFISDADEDIRITDTYYQLLVATGYKGIPPSYKALVYESKQMNTKETAFVALFRYR